MHSARVRLWTRRNRVEARVKLAQELHEIRRVELHFRMRAQQIENVASEKKFRQLAVGVRRSEIFQLHVAAARGHSLEQGRRNAAEFAVVRQLRAQRGRSEERRVGKESRSRRWA